ncbi:hypothetical protein [Clostridium saudiense]|uniref:hypothetical protein n=1 Tax=Clostridium saudiense TaxID=1414720 RepID=UPI0018A8C166|nr:hypothetical protein [Clostridium saudiense]MDU2292215.1 hypothetical protein [Clostridium celatum]MDU4326131.1 hypothetical protein [Clostridium celatum]
MEKSISKLRIAERKKVIVKRIEKLEQFILEGNTNSLARKAFEINLRHLREEHKELEILERRLLNEEA